MADNNNGPTIPFAAAPMGPGGLAETREALAQAAKASLTDSRWHGWHPMADLAVVLCFVLVMTVLLIQPGGGKVPQPAVDTVAHSTIRAGRDVLVEDWVATKANRENAKAAVLEVFDYDSDLYFSLGDRVFLALAKMEKMQQDSSLSPTERRQAFQKEIGVAVNAGAVAFDAEC